MRRISARKWRMAMEQIAKGVWKAVLGEPEELTPVYFREGSIRSEALESMGEASLPEALSRLHYEVTVRGITVTIPMSTTEDIFGFGLQLKSLNQAGRKRRIRVNSDPPADTGESHAPAPFYVSSAGYGLFVDTFRYADFYMGTSVRKGVSADKREVNQKHKEFSESALYAFKRASEEREIIIDIPGAKGITLYFFAGNISEAVRRYNLFSGGGCLIPMWGLGVWYRIYGGSDQAKALSLAEEFRREQIPVSVLGLEPGWHSHSYSCTYQWSSMFPDPDRMTGELRSRGYQVNLWEHAFVYPAAEFYDELLPYSGSYEVWNGLVPDFADPSACEIFGGYHEKNFIEKGIGGFKLDECDNSDYNPSNWSFPDSTSFPSGMDGEQMHNAIGVLYQKLLNRLYRKHGKRTASQVRSSGALAAPYPFFLYSDLYGHRDFIRGMASAGFSGLLWSPEVRSCVSGEDLLRRVETVVFSPQALLNCWRIPNPPWKQVDTAKNLADEWMENSEYYTEVCRRYLSLRMSLLPYLYSAYMEYYLTGRPPVRALVMDYEKEERAAQIDSEYLFGDSLLVCPLTLEDGTERTIWLPEGRWHSFFTGEILEGGREYTIHADYDEIPVYVKDGALLPLAQPVPYVDENTVFQVRIRSYGSGEGSFILYEDDFTGLAAEKGDYNTLTVTRDQAGRITWKREGKEPERYQIAGLWKEGAADGEM